MFRISYNKPYSKSLALTQKKPKQNKRKTRLQINIKSDFVQSPEIDSVFL